VEKKGAYKSYIQSTSLDLSHSDVQIFELLKCNWLYVTGFARGVMNYMRKASNAW
jgi:hypothetical protein